MRYRCSRKPPGSFISLIFSTPLLMVWSQTNQRGGMPATSTVLGAAVTTASLRPGAVVAIENRRDQWTLVALLTSNQRIRRA